MRAYRKSWRLAWPLILSNLSVPLLGFVDTAVVGHLDSPHYLGAVALGASVVSVLYWLFGFLRMGTTALTAQAFGALDSTETRAALGRALLLAVGFGLAVIVAGPLVISLSTRLFAPTADVLPQFHRYLVIRLLGAPAALGSFALLGWLLGLQDSRSPLFLMLFTNGVNAVLCVLLVFGLGMTAAGVALATVVAEYAGFGMGLLVVRRTWRGYGGWPGWHRLLVLDRFKRLLVVNRDLFLRSLMLQAVFVAFTALSSRQGELVLAANAILLTYFTAAAYGLDGFAHAAEAMVGRTVGAGDRPGFRAAVRAGFVNAAALALVMTLIFALLGGLGIRLMTGLADVQAQALAFLPYAVVLPAVSVWAFLYDGMFFGATRTAELRNGMLVALALYGLLVWVLVPAFGNHGLWLAFLLFLGARAVILAAIYRHAGGAAGFVPVPQVAAAG